MEQSLQKSAVKAERMGNAPMLPLIFSMSLPAMFSMLIQSMYNVVDSYFVSRLGQDALTAVSLAFPVQMLLVAFAVGTGVGINSLISRRMGERRHEEANRAASHGLSLGVATGLLFALLGAVLIRPFLESFHPSSNVLSQALSYTYIVTLLSVGCFLQINLEKNLQATGNMIFPMLFQLSGALTNIALDPILIFGLLGFPAMGVTGAAIATVAGQFVAMIFSLIVVFTRAHDVHITLKGAVFHWETIREIYRVGIPAIIMQSISAVLNTLLNMILIGFSEAAVSVLGIYYKLQSFIFMPVFGLTQGLMPIMGFNFGARKKKRIYSTLRIGGTIALLIMGAGLLIFELLPAQLLAIFQATPEMLAIGTVAFRLIALCFLPAGVGIIVSTLFQAIGMGTKSLIISVLRQLAVILPAAYLFSLIGLNYVWLAFPLAEIVSLGVATFLLIRVIRKTIKPLEEPVEAPQNL